MAKQAITLKVAGRSYAFDIESDKEEMYRLAEREVNTYLARIMQKRYENWSEKDYLSMTALKFAIATVEMRQSREGGDGGPKRLHRVDGGVGAYLNELEPEKKPGGGEKRYNPRGG